MHVHVYKRDTRMQLHFHVIACLIQSHYSRGRVGNVESLIDHTMAPLCLTSDMTQILVIVYKSCLDLLDSASHTYQRQSVAMSTKCSHMLYSCLCCVTLLVIGAYVCTSTNIAHLSETKVPHCLYVLLHCLPLHIVAGLLGPTPPT